MRGEGIVIGPCYTPDEKVVDKKKFREEIERKTKAFLKKGGKIQRVAIGVSGVKPKKLKFNRMEE